MIKEYAKGTGPTTIFGEVLVTANTVKEIHLPPPGGPYYIYLVAEDNAGNLQSDDKVKRI